MFSFLYIYIYIYIFFFLLILLNTNNASCKHYLDWAQQIFTNHMLKFISKNVTYCHVKCSYVDNRLITCMMIWCMLYCSSGQKHCSSAFRRHYSLSLALSVTELKAINPPRVSALNCWKAKPMCFSQRKLCVEWHDGLINVKDWACVEGNYSELACCFVLADADGWLKVVLTA